MKKIAFAFLLIFGILNAAEISLKKGETKVFNTQKDITTVFSSDPDVINYKLVNPKKIIVFATGDGSASVKAFGGEEGSDLLLNYNFLVDSISANLDKISEIITLRNPGVKDIVIERLSVPGEKGYVISGEVPSTRMQEDVYKMALAALGLAQSSSKDKSDEKAKASDTQSSNSSDSDSGAKDYRNSSLIDKLKLVGTNLINIEILVADVQKSFLQALGIDINNGGVFALPFIHGRQSPLIHGGDLKDTYNPNQYKAYMPFNLTGILTAFNNDQVAKILAKPNISVLSGKEASFSVTDEYTTFSAQTSDGTTTISPNEPKQFGISLSVRPTIENNGKILIEIAQNSSDISGIVSRGDAVAANIKKRDVYSTILLEDGQSFMLSGLIDERDEEIVGSIPGFGDLPIIGGAFRKSGLRKSKSELVILATVKTVQPLKDNEQYKIPVFKSRKLFESVLNIKTLDKTKTKHKQDEFLSNIGFVY